ncbi:MAG: site-specific integrase [Dermatophilaceae bacterium]
MTRAKRDFGTIRKRANGRWQAYYMGPDQAFHRAPSTFEAKVDAEAWLAAERRLMQNDEWSPSKSRRAKVMRSTEMFGPYAEAWLEQRELKPRTQALYRRLLDRFILPAFAEVSLRDITPQVVRTWHSGLDATRPTQRAHAYSLLRSILSTAVDDEIVRANPCRIKGAGSTRRLRPVKPVTLDQLETLLTEMPERYRALVVLGAWCGLRFGELIELRRSDVDVNDGTIFIQRGVVRVNGEVRVGKPKSEAGIRRVALPPHVITMLKEHLRHHVGPRADALLFPSVGDPDIQVHSNTVRRYWLRARQVAGVPNLRIHDLRHTGGVMAAEEGATQKEVMVRLGHSSLASAAPYMHAAEGRDADIAGRLTKRYKKWAKRRGVATE